jgi:hypothetical protein
MEIKTTATPLLEWRGDGLAIGFWEDALDLNGDLAPSKVWYKRLFRKQNLRERLEVRSPLALVGVLLSKN